jgi:hypothetical protein
LLGEVVDAQLTSLRFPDKTAVPLSIHMPSASSSRHFLKLGNAAPHYTVST